MVATEIKAPVGSVYQNHVYTCFMVKMRINFASFELLWFNLGWGQCARKDFRKFEFSGSLGQKFQI